MIINWINDRLSNGYHLVEFWQNENLVSEEATTKRISPVDYEINGVCLVYRGNFDNNDWGTIEIWYDQILEAEVSEKDFPYVPPCDICPSFGEQSEEDRVEILFRSLTYVRSEILALVIERGEEF